jgi:uncharacterized protein (DUF885 family)
VAAPATADAFTRLAAAQVRAEVRWAPEMSVFARVPLPGNALPAIAPEAVALRVAAAHAAVQQAKALPVATLAPASREALALFLREREEELEGARFPEELFPLSAPDGGFALWSMTALARGEVVLETAADHAAWLQVLGQVPAWVEAAITNLNQAEARGLGLAPEAWRSLSARVARAAAAELVPPEGAWGNLSPAAQQTLAARYTALTIDKLRPALRRLQARLEVAARQTQDAPVWTDLPLGEAWYAFRLRRATGMSFTPRQWHDVALAEVQQLEARLVGATPAALAVVIPVAVPVAAPVEALATPTSPLAWERLSLAEVPAWQRSTPQPAHRDGYGVYRLLVRGEVAAPNDAAAPGDVVAAETALKEVRDQVALLVIDTGLHGLGWNRQQAADYLAAHSRWQGAAALAQVGAVLASAGYAAAPAAGGLRLWQLRQALAVQQGAAFDEALFEQQLGAWGLLPLGVLEQRMRAWADAKAATAAAVVPAASPVP